MSEPVDLEGIRKLIDRLYEDPSGRELRVGLDPTTTRVWNDLCIEAGDALSRLADEVFRVRNLASDQNTE